MSAIATCTRCGASTKLTDRLASQLQGKATCVACAGDCVVEPEGYERARLMKGSQVPQPTGARCTRCAKLLTDDAHGGFCTSDCAMASSDDVSDAKLRELVLARDGGRCASCGINCVTFREHLNEVMEAAKKDPEKARAWSARLLVLARAGFDRDSVESGKALWQMDHDPPRVKGGTNTLSGVRSLCLACHKAATSLLASNRAAARKPRGRYGR